MASAINYKLEDVRRLRKKQTGALSIIVIKKNNDLKIKGRENID